jgi:hypothetical protein
MIINLKLTQLNENNDLQFVVNQFYLFRKYSRNGKDSQILQNIREK